MSDMTRAEAIRLLDLNREYLKNTNNIGLKDDIKALDMAINSLQIDEQYDLMYEELDFVQPHKKIPVNLQIEQAELKTEQFAKWVASEIFDEMWEYNKDAFAEIACRKLAKLGIVRAKGDEWELVEPQESEE